MTTLYRRLLARRQRWHPGETVGGAFLYPLCQLDIEDAASDGLVVVRGERFDDDPELWVVQRHRQINGPPQRRVALRSRQPLARHSANCLKGGRGEGSPATVFDDEA